jgi:hypothetical protein
MGDIQVDGYHFRDVTKLIAILCFLFGRPGTVGLLFGLISSFF